MALNMCHTLQAHPWRRPPWTKSSLARLFQLGFGKEPLCHSNGNRFPEIWYILPAPLLKIYVWKAAKRNLISKRIINHLKTRRPFFLAGLDSDSISLSNSSSKSGPGPSTCAHAGCGIPEIKYEFIASPSYSLELLNQIFAWFTPWLPFCWLYIYIYLFIDIFQTLTPYYITSQCPTLSGFQCRNPLILCTNPHVTIRTNIIPIKNQDLDSWVANSIRQRTEWNIRKLCLKNKIWVTPLGRMWHGGAVNSLAIGTGPIF